MPAQVYLCTDLQIDRLSDVIVQPHLQLNMSSHARNAHDNSPSTADVKLAIACRHRKLCCGTTAFRDRRMRSEQSGRRQCVRVIKAEVSYVVSRSYARIAGLHMHVYTVARGHDACAVPFVQVKLGEGGDN